MDPHSIEVATKVIIHAGNARTLVDEALVVAAAGDVDGAEAKIAQAREEIHSAHATQTGVIQAEARGEEARFSLLMTHAQDTLMAAMSEVRLARHMLQLYRRIGGLEQER